MQRRHAHAIFLRGLCDRHNRRPPVRGMISTLATVWRIASPLFPVGGPLARPHAAGGGDRHRAVDRRHHRAAQPVERALLQCAAGSQLERLRLRARLFLRARRDLHRARGLSALSEPVAADPLAALDDAQPISTTGSPAPITTACSFWATPPTTPTSASPRTSSSSSRRHQRRWHSADRARPAELDGHARLRSSSSCGRCRRRRRCICSA